MYVNKKSLRKDYKSAQAKNLQEGGTRREIPEDTVLVGWVLVLLGGK
jgi:hypothetical protein